LYENRQPAAVVTDPIANYTEFKENISGNSLSEYNKKYAPPYRMRFSMLNLQYNSGLLSSPAPLAGWIDKWMSMLNNQ
jgi:hypothetical protein